MKKNVTIKDIARAAGVHVSTVSRALSPSSGVSLSADVVAKIQKTAQRMEYRPNRIASGLRTKRTMTVGIMLPDIENALFPPIVRGIESALEPAGYTTIMVNTDDKSAREKSLFDVLISRGVDGIITAAVKHIDPELASMAQDVAIVTVNRRIEGARIPSVVNDDAGGIRMMLQKLYDVGHRHIGHIAGPEELSTGVQRRSAFETVCQTIGLSCPTSLIATSKRYTEEEGIRCAAEILEKNTDVTALLCANDRLAIGAIEAITKKGLNCPIDISVTGFNDIPFLDLMTPKLSTVRILQFDVGRIAAETLLKKMIEPEAQVSETIIMPVRIIERDSIAPPKKR